MGISRLHIALLAIMSLFTGIIAPGTSTQNWLLAYPMTDARTFSYVLLFFLIIGFYTASIHAWRFFRYNGILIFGIVSILFFLTLTGQVHDPISGLEALGLSWGWIFFVAGIGLLAWSYRRTWSEEYSSELRYTIDILLGIVGSFTLACIAGVIVMISLSFSQKSYQQSILTRMFSSGSIITESSGIIMTEPYPDISSVKYDRKSDTISATILSGTIWQTRITRINDAFTMSGIYEHAFLLQDHIYAAGKDGKVYSESGILKGYRTIGDTESLLIRSGSDWNIRSDMASWSLDGSWTLWDPVLSQDHMTLAWKTVIWSGMSISKMGKQLWWTYDYIHRIDLSSGGYDLMALIESSGTLQIVKNGKLVSFVHPKYMTGSYRSNGSHSIYTASGASWYQVVIDSEMLPVYYDDIREVFLEKNGASYAYFAKPLGGTRYCLFTKYKGNICGFDGYMNPRLSADGSSILYAWLQDGIWKIYRNTEIIVWNTQYMSEDNSADYVFFDTTNPRTYLFVKKEQKTGKYTLIKNGKTLPGVWEDFGTDVSFGYDNHIILRLRDHNWWRIVEI